MKVEREKFVFGIWIGVVKIKYKKFDKLVEIKF